MKAHTIRQYMTQAPHTIGEDIQLSKAMTMMRELQIRHLPVQARGVLMGVISDRDIKLALTVHPAAKDLKVGDVMTEGAYSVAADTSLEEVTSEMAKHKYGCAIVTNAEGRAVGIFTSNDAVRVLGECLHRIDLQKEALLRVS